MKKYKLTLIVVFLILFFSPMNLFSAGLKENPKETLLNNEIIKDKNVFIDSYNREISLPIEVNSVISLGPNLTEIIATLKPEALIGRTDYGDFPKWVTNIESIGNITSPNIEKIIELSPDLVVSSTHVKKETIQLIENAGIQSASLYNSSSINGSYKLILDMGILLNKEKEANEIVSQMKKDIESVEMKVAGLEKPKVYYVVSFGQYGDYTAGGNTFIGQMINIAGGNNIAEELNGWSYSLEKIIEKDPDIIIVSKNNNELEKFLSTKPYNELRAVKENKIFTIDNNKLDRQGIRNSEGILDLALIFHPEVFNY